MKQLSIFDFMNEPKRITKPIRLIELFAGIGSQAKALENLGVNFVHHRVCEFDKYAVASYNAVHGTNFKPSDITKITAEDLGIVDTDKYEYIMTYSFPCQDLSNAGKQAGMSKGSGTRSGLLWEVERLLNECKELPQVLLMENVPQVHGKKNMEDWLNWCKTLESFGYQNYWQDLNAKNYGIPQNRNRCFMVSLLGNYSYEFPKARKLERHLCDMLEDEVDEKFYLSVVSNRIVGYLGSAAHTKHKQIYQRPRGNNRGGVYNCCPTITTSAFQENTGVLVYYEQKTMPKERFFKQAMETLHVNNCEVGDTIDAYNKKVNRSGVSPTLTTRPEGFKTAILPVVGNTKGAKILVDKDIKPCIAKNFEREKYDIAQSEKEIYQCKCDSGWNDNKVGIKTSPTLRANNSHTAIYSHYRIRKLTPLECWRLMGFSDSDFGTAKQVNSNCQLYKQAGNSIVVDVLMAIFKKML